MRLFSSRIKNVVPLSLLAVLVCTSCSQDSELDQSLEELENGDYQTLADMNMTRSGETVSRLIKAGSTQFFDDIGGYRADVRLMWGTGYNNGLEPRSTITGDIYLQHDKYNFHLLDARCEWDDEKINTINCKFTYALVNDAGYQVGQDHVLYYSTTVKVKYVDNQ